jgi:quinol monooxygenase YgiN
MTASLIVAAVGAVAAAIGTGLLTARSARTPRIFLIAWTVAVFALAVALGAQTLGDESGYTALIFRCMEIGAQALAPLALCLSLVELISRSVTGRFLMRLAASALGIILLAILGTDPLGTTTPLSKSWPDPTAFYQLIPLGLIKFVAAFTILTAVVSGIVALARSGRGREFAAVVGPALATAAAATIVAVPGLMMIAHVRQHASVFALTGLLAAALTWLAATTAGRRGLAEGRLENDRDGARQYADSDWYEPDDERDYPRGRADDFDRRDDYLSPPYLDERPRYPDENSRYLDERPRYPDENSRYPDESRRYPNESPRHADENSRYPDKSPRHPGEDPPYPGEELYRDRRAEPSRQWRSDADDDLRYPALAALAAERPDPDEGIRDPASRSRFEPEGHRGEPDGGADGGDQFFGQITIYTLIDERIEEFDLMTERVVQEVRSREPGTLVYIVHAVPTAPMQRILYEVYRDRAAYDDHLAQPYVTRYVAESRSMVLATNAIELGLQQAKVTPLPSYSAISDILSESGIDLTGVTRSARGTAAAETSGRRRSELPDPLVRHADPLQDPHLGSRRYEPAREDSDEPGYEDWAGLRDGDPWYR